MAGGLFEGIAMADHRAEASGAWRWLLVSCDVVAILGFCAFIAQRLQSMYCARQGYYGCRTTGYTILSFLLGTVAACWLLRRHLLSILAFIFLAMSSDDPGAKLTKGTRILFATMDVGSWCVTTMITSIFAWTLSGLPWVYLASDERVPLQLRLYADFLPPAFPAVMWLLLRSKFMKNFLFERTRQMLVQAGKLEESNGSSVSSPNE